MPELERHLTGDMQHAVPVCWALHSAQVLDDAADGAGLKCLTSSVNLQGTCSMQYRHAGRHTAQHLPGHRGSSCSGTSCILVLGRDPRTPLCQGRSWCRPCTACAHTCAVSSLLHRGCMRMPRLLCRRRNSSNSPAALLCAALQPSGPGLCMQRIRLAHAAYQTGICKICCMSVWHIRLRGQIASAAWLPETMLRKPKHLQAQT